MVRSHIKLMQDCFVSMKSGLEGRNNTIGDFEPGRIFEGSQ